jgi:microcystin-dependent protein
MPYPTGDALSARLVGWRLLLPDNAWVVQCIIGALSDLCYSDSWEQEGDTTPDQAANAFEDINLSLMPYPNLVGMIMLWTHPLTTYPDGVLPCDGALYLRADYPDLFAIIGTTYSAVGDPSDQFRVPDLQGRSALGAGAGAGLTPRAMADTLGVEEVTLGTNQLPTHSHSDYGHFHSMHGHLSGLALAPGELPVALPAVPYLDTTSYGNASISNAGSGQAFNIMNPALALRYVIVSGVKNA